MTLVLSFNHATTPCYLIELYQDRVEDIETMTGYTMPEEFEFQGELIRRKIQFDDYGSFDFVQIQDRQYANLWNGKKQWFSTYA